jgi:hypothetical protein
MSKRKYEIIETYQHQGHIVKVYRNPDNEMRCEMVYSLDDKDYAVLQGCKKDDGRYEYTSLYWGGPMMKQEGSPCVRGCNLRSVIFQAQGWCSQSTAYRRLAKMLE